MAPAVDEGHWLANARPDHAVGGESMGERERERDKRGEDDEWTGVGEKTPKKKSLALAFGFRSSPSPPSLVSSALSRAVLDTSSSLSLLSQRFARYTRGLKAA